MHQIKGMPASKIFALREWINFLCISCAYSGLFCMRSTSSSTLFSLDAPLTGIYTAPRWIIIIINECRCWAVSPNAIHSQFIYDEYIARTHETHFSYFTFRLFAINRECSNACKMYTSSLTHEQVQCSARCCSIYHILLQGIAAHISDAPKKSACINHTKWIQTNVHLFCLFLRRF